MPQETNETEAAIEAAKEQKFQRRGFAPAPTEEITAKAEEVPQREETAGTEEEIGTDPLPGEFALPETAAATSEGGEAPPEETPAGEEESYRIGGKTFRTQKEAWTYAEELEREKLAADAFRQGIETAQYAQKGNTPEVMPQPEPEEELPDYYYTDPKRWAKEQRDKITQQAKAETLRELDMRQRHQKTMNDFYSDYPDLVGDEELVDTLITRNWKQIEKLDVKPGLKIIADQARNWIEERLRRRMPATELKRTANTASSGTAGKVTPKKVEEKSLDFVSQNKKLKTPQARAEARKRLGLPR